MRTAPEEFRVEVRQTQDWTVLEVHGELDVASVRSLRSIVAESVGDMTGCLVCDLRAVPYIDSAGLHVLVETRRLLGPSRPLKLVVTPGSLPDRVIRLGRFDTWMPIFSTLDAALAAGPAGDAPANA